MRRITFFFALLATLFMAGTQTASAVGVEAEMNTGKWYRIKLYSSEMVVAAYNTWGGGPVFGQYVTDGTCLCTSEYDDNDGQLFRFVSMGPGEGVNNFYAIQNKATGLYVSAQGKLTKAPYKFVVKEDGPINYMFAYKYDYENSCDNWVGYFCELEDSSIDINESPNNMFLILEPAGDVEENFKPAPLVVCEEAGKISFQCWPVELSTPKGMFKAVCFKNDALGNKTLGLKKITSAGAGEPFIYIHGMGEEWSGQYLEAEFQIGNGICQAPVKANGLVGAFVDAVANFSYCFSDYSNVIQTMYTVDAYSCYVDSELPTGDIDCDLELAIDMDPIPTAIDNTLEKVGKAGNVYDMSGRKVATGVTLNEVQGLPAGTYIFNGVKVGVK